MQRPTLGSELHITKPCPQRYCVNSQVWFRGDRGLKPRVGVGVSLEDGGVRGDICLGEYEGAVVGMYALNGVICQDWATICSQAFPNALDFSFQVHCLGVEASDVGRLAFPHLPLVAVPCVGSVAMTMGC